jgi:hypothetical protein
VCSKHVEVSNKHITEETVRQVGHLPELYEDARSEKHKIYLKLLFLSVKGSVNKLCAVIFEHVRKK